MGEIDRTAKILLVKMCEFMEHRTNNIECSLDFVLILSTADLPTSTYRCLNFELA